MPGELSLRDRDERERAATTFDRNIVVTAGAGTGKTTLLVDRMIHLLMREPNPLRISDVVALTFTNKAANEMKSRLRLRLESYVGHDLPQSAPSRRAARDEVDALRTRYRLDRSDIEARARDALRYLERGEIGTIHSFAASLLRLYPLDAALDPRFKEDDGKLFAEHFESLWPRWLDGELSGRTPATSMWKAVLGRFSLDELRQVALGLCSENVELDRIHCGSAADHTTAVLQQWLGELELSASRLIEEHPGDRKIERTLRIVHKVLVGAMQGDPAKSVAEDERGLLARSRPSPPGDWTRESFARARELIRVAVALLGVDQSTTDALFSLLRPFAARFRESLAREGLVTFDGLLLRARNLLRDHISVRQELKTRFKAVLVDEFQDTDPLQYEILLFLCEDPGSCADDWQNIRLMPGKVFVVGDPKQSIYAFRGADIAAYLEVVDDVVMAQDGIECRLTTSFRSGADILGVVNGAFAQLFGRRPGLQPEYIAIDSAQGDDSSHSEPAVTLRKVQSSHAQVDADTARRLEAESLADWVAREVIGRIRVRSDGREVVAEPGHVAYLIRSLTHVQTYLDPLRRRGIGYVVEGERSFYATQEVIDVVNLLRAIDNPHDCLALVGVLRSPLGSQNDRELFELSRRSLLDYRLIASPNWVDLPSSVAGLYQRLFRLHRESRSLRAAALVARIFEEFPLVILTAGAFAGERGVANLDKVREVAEEMAGPGAATLKEIVAELERRVRYATEEPESPLEEEGLDAVKVMSIHKSKGLEFPVVVLVDSAAAVEQGRRPQVEVTQDWRTGLVGLRVGQASNLPGVFLDARRRLREEQERIRLLYVAMTRATTRLLISCGGKMRRGDSLLSLLDSAAGGVLHGGTEGVVSCGPGKITVESRVVSLEDHAATKRQGGLRANTSDWSFYQERWQRRRERHAKLRELPLFLTPTGLTMQHAQVRDVPGEKRGSRLMRGEALLLGEVAHRILEDWNFQSENVAADLDKALAARLPHLAEDLRPLIEKELRTIWGVLIQSAVYRELAHARVRGREVPFLMPWGEQIMQGVIDLVYEFDGELYVADYKTDYIADDEIDRVRTDYRYQAEIYTKAVERSLGRKVAAFKLILLRLGKAISA